MVLDKSICGIRNLALSNAFEYCLKMVVGISEIVLLRKSSNRNKWLEAFVMPQGGGAIGGRAFRPF